MLARSEQAALNTVRHAARVSAVYRELLAEHRVDAAALRSRFRLADLPVLAKSNTFERFGLDKLSRHVPTEQLADVLTSSGRGGKSFGFRISTRKQHARSWFNIDLGLQDAFDIDGKTTLLVNCLPMGVVFESRAVTMANLSVREDMACAILCGLGKSFQQTLVCTDPLFIRQLMMEAKTAGIDWSALNTSVIIGEEMLVEGQRDYIAARMGMNLDDPQSSRAIISSFGIGELGLNLLFETRETIRIRRAMRSSPELLHGLRRAGPSGALPSIFCFSPLRCHIEVLDPDADGFGELCFTMLDNSAVIPLPRYATGDLGKLIQPAEAEMIAQHASTAAPWLPMVAVLGRIKDRISDGPSVEDVKDALYADHDVADLLTGAFRMDRDSNGGQRLTVQANNAHSADDPVLRERLSAVLKQRQIAAIQLQVLAPTSFPHRPLLDFERKFSYLAP